MDGLDGLSGLVISPDGLNLYAVGEVDDALVVFSRLEDKGHLVFRQILRDGVGANGLGNALGIAISPDGKHLYSAASSDNGVGVFVRNAGTGLLTFDSIKVDGGVDGPLTIDGLAGATAVAVAPNGAHVYAAGGAEGGLAVFSRNPGTGKLTFKQALKDGIGGVDGLDGVAGLALDGDGSHVYAVGAVDGGLAVFARNGATGLLSFVEVHLDGDGGVDGLAGAAAVSVSVDGNHVYVAGADDSAIAIFARDAVTGQLEFIEAAVDGAGGLDGMGGVSALALSPDDEQIYAAGESESALAVLKRGSGSLCTPGGSGDLDDVSRIAAGGSAVYSIRAFLSASAVGTLENTASASTAQHVVDPDLGNNVGSVTVDLTPVVELIVTKDDGQTEEVPGTEVVYTITVTNLGPSDLAGATLLDNFGADLLNPVWSCIPTRALEFVEEEPNGVGGAVALVGDFAIAVSPDPDGPQAPLPGGAHVYVGSRKSRAVAHFTRNLATGELDLVSSYVDGVGGIDGLNGFGSLALSPDGQNLYATGGLDHALAAFGRDPATGALTYLESRFESDPDVDGLEGAFGVAVSADGRHVYATGQLDDTLVAFARDEATGELTFVEREKDGFGGLELNVLDGATAVAVTPDGRHVLVASPVHDRLSIFARDPVTGELDFVDLVEDGVGGVDGLDTLQSIAVSPSGQFVYAAGLADDGIAVFGRDVDTGLLEFLDVVKDGEPGVTGLDGVRALALSPDGQFLYAAGYNSDALAVFARNGATGLLTEIEVQLDGVFGVDGLDGARALAASGDGGDVYVVGEYDDGVAAFRRVGRAICGAGGSGAIADPIALALNGSVAYTVTANVAPCAAGSLLNTAEVIVPPGTTNTGDVSATDTDALTPVADLSIEKSNGVSQVVAGTSVVYTITVHNTGPSCSGSALVSDVLPAELSGATWTCAASGGGICDRLRVGERLGIGDRHAGRGAGVQRHRQPGSGRDRHAHEHGDGRRGRGGHGGGSVEQQLYRQRSDRPRVRPGDREDRRPDGRGKGAAAHVHDHGFESRTQCRGRDRRHGPLAGRSGRHGRRRRGLELRLRCRHRDLQSRGARAGGRRADRDRHRSAAGKRLGDQRRRGRCLVERPGGAQQHGLRSVHCRRAGSPVGEPHRLGSGRRRQPGDDDGDLVVPAHGSRRRIRRDRFRSAGRQRPTGRDQSGELPAPPRRAGWNLLDRRVRPEPGGRRRDHHRRRFLQRVHRRGHRLAPARSRGARESLPAPRLQLDSRPLGPRARRQRRRHARR